MVVLILLFLGLPNAKGVLTRCDPYVVTLSY